MKSRTWENMTPEEQEQEAEMCRHGDRLEAQERRDGYNIRLGLRQLIFGLPGSPSVRVAANCRAGHIL